jgi:hypothetical protein
MTSYQSHPLPQPPGGPEQSQQQGYVQNDQQTYQSYQQGSPQRGQQQQQQQQQYQPPQPPLHSQQQRQRPKSRSLSFRSNGSAKSGGNKAVDMHETHAEKDAKRLHSKADPTLAMSEAEPGTSPPPFFSDDTSN